MTRQYLMLQARCISTLYTSAFMWDFLQDCYLTSISLLLKYIFWTITKASYLKSRFRWAYLLLDKKTKLIFFNDNQSLVDRLFRTHVEKLVTQRKPYLTTGIGVQGRALVLRKSNHTPSKTVHLKNERIRVNKWHHNLWYIDLFVVYVLLCTQILIPHTSELKPRNFHRLHNLFLTNLWKT